MEFELPSLRRNKVEVEAKFAKQKQKSQDVKKQVGFDFV
jgi:hypothetical protein